jgi:tRNA 2-thiouridine synthesizing protein E
MKIIKNPRSLPMAQKVIAGAKIDVDNEGYLTDLGQWNKKVGEALAKDLDIKMTDKHWAVIDYIQKTFKDKTPLTIRKLGQSGVANTKDLYELFPEGPLKKASLIAGIPKPKGCI